MKVLDFASYNSQLQKALAQVKGSDIRMLSDLVIDARERGKTIFLFGNGDSANNANHFASDLSKGCIVPGNKARFRAISLNQNVSLMTAWSNDISYVVVFREQLENLLQPGDVVIGISTSGNSPNVLMALEYANRAGAITVALTAFKGGKIASVAKHNIIVDTDNVEIAEDVHWVIGHLLKSDILERSGGRR